MLCIVLFFSLCFVNVSLFMIGYCAYLSPNQAPTQDFYLLKKLVGLEGGDGYQV